MGPVKVCGLIRFDALSHASRSNVYNQRFINMISNYLDGGNKCGQFKSKTF